MTEAETRQKLLRNVKKEVKQIMEEAVTRKFVHMDSSHIISFCAVVEACLLHGLKRRAAGLLCSNKVAALFMKVGKSFTPAEELCQKVQELEQLMENNKQNQYQLNNDGVKKQSKQANVTPQALKHLWIRTALMEKLLDRIVLYLVENCSTFYEREAMLTDPVDGPILASLLVGPCALEYTKMKTADHFWTDPSADELVQRHRIHSGHCRQDSPSRRPALIQKRQSSGSMDDRPLLWARDYVESLHQNSRATLLFGKNNVLVQPRDDMEAIPGYLSLHQTADLMTLKWTPNQLMNGTVGELDTDKSVYWDFAMTIRLEEIVYLHCHQQVDSGGTVVLVSQDGIQRPPLRFPRGGHLLQFLTCLETGLLPHGQLDPPLWSQRGKGKVFPKLRNRSPQGSCDSVSDKDDDEATDYVFRILFPGSLTEFVAPELVDQGVNMWHPTPRKSSCSSCSQNGSSDGSLPNGCNQDRAPLKLLCDTMKYQIISRAFYGWLAYCRHLSTVRTHLSALVNPTMVDPDLPHDCRTGLSVEVWKGFLLDCSAYDEQELMRRVYIGGVDPTLRREVWPFLLGHYHFSMTHKQRTQVDEQVRASYQQTVEEWRGCESIVKQRESEKHAEALARCSSGASAERGVVQRDSTLSADNISLDRQNAHSQTDSNSSMQVFGSVEEVDQIESESRTEEAKPDSPVKDVPDVIPNVDSNSGDSCSCEPPESSLSDPPPGPDCKVTSSAPAVSPTSPRLTVETPGEQREEEPSLEAKAGSPPAETPLPVTRVEKDQDVLTQAEEQADKKAETRDWENEVVQLSELEGIQETPGCVEKEDPVKDAGKVSGTSEMEVDKAKRLSKGLDADDAIHPVRAAPENVLRLETEVSNEYIQAPPLGQTMGIITQVSKTTDKESLCRSPTEKPKDPLVEEKAKVTKKAEKPSSPGIDKVEDVEPCQTSETLSGEKDEKDAETNVSEKAQTKTPDSVRTAPPETNAFRSTDVTLALASEQHGPSEPTTHGLDASQPRTGEHEAPQSKRSPDMADSDDSPSALEMEDIPMALGGCLTMGDVWARPPAGLAAPSVSLGLGVRALEIQPDPGCSTTPEGTDTALSEEEPEMESFFPLPEMEEVGEKIQPVEQSLTPPGIVPYSQEQLDLYLINLHRIDKDVRRCDRTFWYFTPANLEKLRNIMCSYVWQHLEIGYVQGMCDLLAPLLVILDDEVMAFSCFSELMKRMNQNFPHGGAMDSHFANMRSLIQILDSELFELMQQNGDYTHFYFCYRWFLLDFKREMVYDDVFSVWETIWAAKHTSSGNFVLFIALALVEMYRDIILENNMDFTDIIKFFNEMAEHHNVQQVLMMARDLVHKVQTLIENK
ncbi:small G protein signaling modulator 1 [Hypomesus transpacificus]|uniref:small G protein signaling modulator 1 n=1 Tax=Hypomesus transpacificus TaxID=137520 RepID=UPI001F08389A|nr:small G protein signaling modulator 1 [Hypomesus transpacificus]